MNQTGTGPGPGNYEGADSSETGAQPIAPPGRAPAGGRDRETNQWAMFIHFSILAGWAIPIAGLVVPILLWQIKKDELPGIVPHAHIVLNWIVTSLVYAAICFILAIIASGSREELISIGALLLVAALIHNLAGYLLGYLLAGLAGLSESDRRTVAFEVGMQNGGMGVGLALDVLKSSAAALAPALLGTWMNITGSTLASYWRDRPPRDLEPAAQASG